MPLDDIYQLRERARVALRRSDLDDAAHALVAAARQTHISEHDYVGILRPLADVLVRRGDARSALTIEWYLGCAGKGGVRVRTLLPRVPAVDRGRTFAALGDKPRAARQMEDAGLVVAPAIYREEFGDWQGARSLWSRLTRVPFLAGAAGDKLGAGEAAYTLALVHFNVGRCAKQCGDAPQAREAFGTSVRLLEEAADQFESVGQRERAFDCFHVLVQIGRDSQRFEDVLEGFINCIRVLREDHLKYFALQYFEDAFLSAKEQKELSAAATLAREAADYARTIGLTSLSLHYTLVESDLWRGVARQHSGRGASPQVAESALLAAVLACGDLGQFSTVGHLYRELGRLDLEPARRAHYARASARYEAVKDEIVSEALVPSHVHQHYFPEVWHADLLEWEERGSASEASANVLLNHSLPEVIRRKAMLSRLTAFAVEARPDDSSPSTIDARVRLAEQLAQLQLYTVLSPLEKLFKGPEPAVKVAVLSAMQTLFFKRSFVTVRTGLRDSHHAVVEQAARAVECLHFPHAFDPLVRIVRESQEASVRASALQALARVDTMEAAEYMLGVLDYGAPADRTAAMSGLKGAHGSRFLELAQTSLPTSGTELQGALREVLRARGVAV
jgi:tetratricopeptide (TPR) repeat protein